MIEQDSIENAVLIVHPSAPFLDESCHKDKNSANGSSFLKQGAYRRNCRDFLKYAKHSDFSIIHFRDIFNGDPQLKNNFEIKPDLEIPTRFLSGKPLKPLYLPINPNKKFNLYACGAYLGGCVKTAIESLHGHMQSLHLVLNCLVPKYENVLASECDYSKFYVFQELDAKGVVYKKGKLHERRL